ncbi:MAG: Eco57I restriction-modification methylase domain-containing protein, partial [Anaerolineae bacterium]
MSPVPAVILDLVERYAHNADRYRRPDYNETQVRREFIDPLFEALGWDVSNRAGAAPQYRPVVHEASLQMGGARGGVRAPDYAFRMGPQVVYYVEAKKPSVDIHADPSPAYQLRRYAWTAKLPLSVLTDFQELAVYDCRFRPAPGDAASQARVVYTQYTEYAERWDELAGILSREAVLRGDFDRWADEKKAKRGTQAVDEAFLGEIEGWRTALAQNIALRNPQIAGVRDLNYAVQKIIDRIIFLRICEDRGIEPYGQLRDAMSGHDVYARLVTLFRRADDRYNSGLFHFAAEKQGVEPADTLTPALAVDDRVLKEILDDLYYPKSPYEFSVLGADILGNVYEQFLGSVIRLTPAHRAVVEPKPEVRKAGGVYYTPRYIVDYIVAHTVGELLRDKTPAQAAWLRILDPACGSGSFLLGAYDYLLRWHLEWYTSHETKQARRETYQGPGGEWRLTSDEKKRILLNNLYGVDIDPQAVEVTKLSLLLKVLEGETSDTLQMEMFQARALPDLGSNIKCGNSLISSDFFQGRQGLLAPQTGLFDDDEWQRVNPFDWEKEFPAAVRACGFDAVIGNPPYIRIQNLKEFAPTEVEFYKGRYRAASKGNYDIYVVFVERGLSLLNPTGKLGFILPHKFMNAQYGEPLRALLSGGRNLSEVVHFGDQQVFDQATTYTCLMFLDKAGQQQVEVRKVTDLPAWVRAREAVTGQMPAERFGAAEWNLVVGHGADLFQRLSEMPVKLGDIAERVFQGLVTSADAVYLLEPRSPNRDGLLSVYSAALDEELEIEAGPVWPLCKGSLDIRRYHAFPSKVVLFPYDPAASAQAGSPVLLSPERFGAQYPRTWAYLLRNRRTLESRENGKMRRP